MNFVITAEGLTVKLFGTIKINAIFIEEIKVKTKNHNPVSVAFKSYSSDF